MKNAMTGIAALAVILTATLTHTGCGRNGNLPQPSELELDRTKLSVETLLLLDQAKRGDPVAQFNLGAMYDSGYYDLPQNYAEALKWYLRAADQGSYSAQYYLAIMYAEGKGVRKNLAKAAKWYRKSAQWYPWAQLQLGIMYTKGQGVWKNHAKAAKWFREAAERRLAEAQYRLGVMYAEGRGVARDDVEAHAWLSLAAEQCHPSASEIRNKITARLSNAAKERAKSLASGYQLPNQRHCQY